ncbi:hypothetical protein [Shumkonia mesophila]|uniref:hypothetical protein n=1 Tax=Shumkonia mesophila TaxID=2838854 RepID=UPI0029348025|nr:hypothetical protein [Shumkonia mesophila]
MKSGHKAEEARRRAHAQFAKPKAGEAKGLSDYEKAKRVTAAKTVRLRALRLEKEAADREVAEKAVAAGVKPPKKTKAGRSEPVVEEEDAEADAEGEREIGEPHFEEGGESEFDE